MILENFLSTHSIDFDEYNITAIREFAELSIESPIDFKSIIKKLQKRQRMLKREETKQLKMMDSIAEASTNCQTNNITYER